MKGTTKPLMANLDITPLTLALFPGPAQLSVASSTVKRGEAGIFSHVSMT